MDKSNGLQLRNIPAPTPQLAQSLSPDQLDAHRTQIAFDVEVVMDGYWDKQPPAAIKAGILADWCDALEDWTQEQVLFGLRKWRNENPNKRPNPGHILSILKDMRGRKELERNPPKPADPPKPRKEPTAEEKAKVAAMVAEVGSSRRHVDKGAA